MVAFVLTLSVVNLAWGYGLGVLLRRVLASVDAEETRGPVSQVSAAPPKPPRPKTIVSAETPLEEVEEPIPEKWLDMLEEESIEAGSFVEASIQVLRLQVGKYREQLLRIDDRARTLLEDPEPSAVRQILGELAALNQDWLGQQREANDTLTSAKGSLGQFEKMGASLETILMDQAAQIETTCSNIDLLDFDTDLAKGCDRLTVEIGRLVDLAHDLRDQMQESLVAVMRADKKLDTLESKLKQDGLTALVSRAGFESTLFNWWRQDIPRQRLLSIGVIDIDRFRKLNLKYGARVGDCLLSAFGSLLDDLSRKDRGSEVICRLDRERFALFLGDTGPHAAMSTIERIRQLVEATSFQFRDDEIGMTVSGGVIEVFKTDNARSVLDRLDKALLAAKKQGRNCTMLDEGEGPKLVEAPEFKVKGRLVRVYDPAHDEEEQAS